MGLTDTLKGDGPFTVFAPTDQAFTDAGIDLNDYDTDEENETLRDILLYHVIIGAAVDSANVTDGMTAEAGNGDTLTFAVTEGTVTIGESTVTTADVGASNGIIHVLDKVLTLPAEEPVDDVPVDEEPADPCDVTIGIDDSGYAYDRNLFASMLAAPSAGSGQKQTCRTMLLKSKALVTARESKAEFTPELLLQQSTFPTHSPKTQPSTMRVSHISQWAWLVR